LKDFGVKPVPTVYFIDPPTPRAPTQKWRDFLDRMLAKPENPTVALMIKKAKQELKRREAQEQRRQS
jgi:hypothetical protein